MEVADEEAIEVAEEEEDMEEEEGTVEVEDMVEEEEDMVEDMMEASLLMHNLLSCVIFLLPPLSPTMYAPQNFREIKRFLSCYLLALYGYKHPRLLCQGLKWM